MSSGLEWWTNLSVHLPENLDILDFLPLFVFKWSLNPVVTHRQYKSCAHHAIFDSNNGLTIKTY